jgi:hypothetical protein
VPRLTATDGVLTASDDVAVTVTSTIPDVSTATPAVLSEDFNTGGFETGMWQTIQVGSGPSVAVANQRLEITIPSTASGAEFAAGIQSRCLVRGDYDLQVDYQPGPGSDSGIGACSTSRRGSASAASPAAIPPAPSRCWASSRMHVARWPARAPRGSSAGGCPTAIGRWSSMPEASLVDMIEGYALEMASDQTVDVVLRAVPDPWPFPAHLRVVPEIVAALDLAESVTSSLAELGLARLKELGDGLDPSWERGPQRRRLLRSVVPSSPRLPRPHPRLQHCGVADAVWDDRAEQDARGLVRCSSWPAGCAEPSFQRRCMYRRVVWIVPVHSSMSRHRMDRPCSRRATALNSSRRPIAVHSSSGSWTGRRPSRSPRPRWKSCPSSPMSSRSHAPNQQYSRDRQQRGDRDAARSKVDRGRSALW